jgi:UDP-2,4-diacetamido-2,4,6-trideoxy-beta-L-altropyranose hydrolase
MRRKILFRADAGQSIGYGHFIRTLALADMLKDDFDCVFYTQAPTDYQINEMSSVCKYENLPLDDSRFDIFLEKLKGDEIVVLDNYFFTTDYQRQIKQKGCKLVCIDDMHDKHYVADVVVNHGLARKEEFDCEAYTKLCLGNQWSLLRRPFLEPIRSKKRENRLVVCFGGADPQRLTDKVITMLMELNTSYEITVILGETAFLSEENRNRVVVKNKLTAQQMAELFETSVVGILPSSSVRIEAVSRGLKVICGYFVDNQQIGFERSLELKDILPIYNYNELSKLVLQKALKDIEGFTFNIPDYSEVPSKYIKLMNSL